MDVEKNNCKGMFTFFLSSKHHGRRNMHFKKIILHCMPPQWHDGTHENKPLYYLSAYGELNLDFFCSLCCLRHHKGSTSCDIQGFRLD